MAVSPFIGSAVSTIRKQKGIILFDNDILIRSISYITTTQFSFRFIDGVAIAVIFRQNPESVLYFIAKKFLMKK